MELITEGVDKINSMKNRESERQLNLQKKQEIKKSIVAENEQLDFFQRTFDQKHNLIESLLKQSQLISKNELPEHFNNISKEILTLQKYVAASSFFLRNYFLKKCQNTLQDLNIRAAELETELLPKKKFGFKNKAKISIKKKNGTDTVDFVSRPSNGDLKIIAKEIPTIECGFYNRSDEILVLTGEDIAKKDVSIENLSNCKIYLEGFPSTLHLNHLTNCHVFSGPVSTSVFAENCDNCTLVIACQQLRLHASQNVDIYLQVTSRAIMEDCNNIAVTRYNWSYENINKDFLEAGLDKQVNNWRCIDDFNWLNAERHSPHWREMEEEERVKEWT